MSCTFPAAEDESCNCTLADRKQIPLFVRWLFSADLPEERLQPVSALANQKFDESKCVTRAVLDAVRTLMEIDLYAVPPFSDHASHAFRGHPVSGWPDGETRSGPTWNEMFPS